MSIEWKGRITLDEGQFLLRMAAVIRCPKALGKESLEEMQMFVDDWITRLRSVLKTYSPRLQKEKRLAFGPEDAWQPAPDGKTWVLVDGLREVEVRLDEEALEGAYWILRIAADSRSEFRVPLDAVDDFVYPLATKLGYYDSLRGALGLGDRSKAIRRTPRTQEIGAQEEKE